MGKGRARLGIPGAVVATVGMLTPSLIILMVSVPHFDTIYGNHIVQKAIKGILAAFVGLLWAMAFKFAVTINWTPLVMTIFIVAFYLLYKDVEILLVVMGAAVAAVAMQVLH